MALSKQQKISFVEKEKGELGRYTLVGIVQLNGTPDRLFQLTKNRLRGKARFVMGRKTLLVKILEGNAKVKHLVKELTGTSAIILSNEDPFELYKGFKANSLRLAAKPHQISPDDISVEAGETTIQPGQAVTELKLAGIDVQIQKGKVIIAKDKVIVRKGTVISPAVAKALKTLDIMPFTASIEPKVFLSGNMSFTKEILNIDPAKTIIELSTAFAQALAVCFKTNAINAYTITPLLQKGFRIAMAVGVEGKVPEPGIIEKLVAVAAAQASALNDAAAPAA